MNKFLDIAMPIFGGVSGGVVAVNEQITLNVIQNESMFHKLVDAIASISVMIPAMIIGAMVGWATKKICDHLYEKYKNRKNGKHKNKIRNKRIL